MPKRTNDDIITYAGDNKILFIDNKNTGLTYYLDSNDKRITPSILKGGYEEELWNRIYQYLRVMGTEYFTFVDIGASIGWFSLNVLRNFRYSRVFAFEPNDTSYNIMKANLETNFPSNKGERRYYDYNMPLSDTDGDEVTFWNDKDFPSGSHVEGNKLRHPPFNFGGWVNKRTNRLDTILEPLPYFFIKIDVEGMEYKVLKGLTKYFEGEGSKRIKDHTQLLIEIHNYIDNTNGPRIYRLLANKGFRIKLLDEKGGNIIEKRGEAGSQDHDVYHVHAIG